MDIHSNVSVAGAKQALIEALRRRQTTTDHVRLSVLGLDLSKQFKRPFKILGLARTLGDFIRKYVGDSIEVYNFKEAPLVLYARLRDPQTLSSGTYGTSVHSTLGDKHEGITPTLVSADPGASQKLAFDRGFWAAFAKPLDVGQRRYLRMSRPFTFEDRSESEEPKVDCYAIDSNFIAPRELQPGTARTEFVYTQIMAWIEKYNLSAGDFAHLKRAQPVELPEIVAILSQLDGKDLARVMIPADVWLKLLKWGTTK